MQFLRFKMDLGGPQMDCFGPYRFRGKPEMYTWIRSFEEKLLPLERALIRCGAGLRVEYDIKDLENHRSVLEPPATQEVIANIRIILGSKYPITDVTQTARRQGDVPQ